MSLADDVIALAQQQIADCQADSVAEGLPNGVCEATRHNDGFVDRYTGGRHEPWCAHFLAYLFRECGAPIPGDVVPSPTVANPLAGVSYMEWVFQEHGWCVMHPQPGDLAFFIGRGSSDPGKGRHVGLIETVDGTRITTIEANENDGVRRERYSLAFLMSLTKSFGRRPEP